VPTGPASSIGRAEHVHDAAEGGLAEGTMMGLPVLLHHHAAAQAVGGTQRDGAHDAVAELLLHFEGQLGAVHRQRRRVRAS
jgi:hypothetical protein